MTEVIKFDNKSNDGIREVEFEFYPKVTSQMKQLKLALKMTTNAENPIAFKVSVDANPINTEIGVVAAIIILIFFNILINGEVNETNPFYNSKKWKLDDNKLDLFQIVHRTVAAAFTTFISIGVLAALHDRPSMSDVIIWVDCESLLLILSMMVLVTILSETGFFEHIALYAFEVSFAFFLKN